MTAKKKKEVLKKAEAIMEKALTKFSNVPGPVGTDYVNLSVTVNNYTVTFKAHSVDADTLFEQGALLANALQETLKATAAKSEKKPKKKPAKK